MTENYSQYILYRLGGFFLAPMALNQVACTEWYDLSASVVVSDEAAAVVNASGITFCQVFKSGNLKDNVVETAVRKCDEVDVVDGIALLPNIEGEYKGSVMEFGVTLHHAGQAYPAELIDSDEDVWCDNVDVDYDSEGNTTYTQFCTSNFEFYHLWAITVPIDIF